MILFILAAIGLLAGVTFLRKAKNFTSDDDKRIIGGAGKIILGISTLMLIYSFLVVIPTGKVGNMSFVNIVSERILPEGTITYKAPWNSVILHNIRVINLVEQIPARTKDDAKVTADITIPFELNPLASVAVTQQIGTEWEYVIQQWLRSSSRDAIAQYTWQEVTSSKKAEVSESIRNEAIKKIASTLTSAGVDVNIAKNAFFFHDIQLRDVKLPPRLETAIESYSSAEKEKETQAQLTLAAVEEAKRRAEEGKGYGNLFEGFPENLDAGDVADVLRAMADKTKADAFSQIVDKGMPGDGKLIVVVGNANPMVGVNGK